MSVLWLLGCLAPFLEAPFVLAPGVDAVQLSLDRDGNLVAALGEAGAVRVDGEGGVQPLWEDDTVGAAGLPDGGFLSWTAAGLQRRDAEGAVLQDLDVNGLRDVAAWCDETVLLATDEGVLRWTGAELESLWPQAVDGLLFHTCQSAVTWMDGRVVRLPDGEVLAEPEGPIRAVASRRDGALYVLHGEQVVLSRVEDDGALTVVARHPGQARDAVFGFTGLVSEANVYLANPGSLDYLRPL